MHRAAILTCLIVPGSLAFVLGACARPIQIVSHVPKGERPVLLDLRPRAPLGFFEELSLEDVELMSAEGERAWELMFFMRPDSSAVQLGSHAPHVYVVVHAPTARAKIRLVVEDANSARVVETDVEKPAGVERVALRWDLANSSGKRVPEGYYWITAKSDTSSFGIIRLMYRPFQSTRP